MSAFIAPVIKTTQGSRQLEVSFGQLSDADVLKSWNVHESHPNHQGAADSVEFAQLAGKRWRYYAARNEVVMSLEDLVKRTRDNTDEIGFLLVGTLPETREILVMAWCRRTWCHHLVLDFLATHPVVLDKKHGYGHVGTAMLLAIGVVTRRAQMPLVWGEATSGSAAFYKKSALQGNRRKVLDHFFIRGKNLAELRKAGELFVIKPS